FSKCGFTLRGDYNVVIRCDSLLALCLLLNTCAYSTASFAIVTPKAGNLESQKVVSSLIEQLRNRSDNRSAAVKRLAKLGSKAVPKLEYAAIHSPSPNIREGALQALVAITARSSELTGPYQLAS